MGAGAPASGPWVALTAGLIVAATVLRLAGVLASPVELHGDEAQYWAWSRALEWGYFSKPPLVAWTIALTTSLFGDAEWAVRLAAPFAHAVTATLLAVLARDLAGPRAGLAAALIYLSLPAVFLSSAIISTDALLLPAYAGALVVLNRLRTWAPTGTDNTGQIGPPLALGVGLGVAVGVGFLAKYAMIYAVVGVGLAIVVDLNVRRQLISRTGLVAAVIALAIVAPNLVWNAQNDFATVGHTAANANWGGSLFHPGQLLKFLTDQLGVVGPLILVAMVWGAVVLARAPGGEGRAARFLLLFAVPILAAVSAQAFISRANANWAVGAYAPLTVLVASWAVWRGRVWLVGAAVAANLVLGGALAVAGLSPQAADAMGLANAFKRARGWEDTTAQVRARFEAGHEGRSFDLVAVDNRLVFHGLEYYGRAAPLPLAMWQRHADVRSHAEQRAPLSAADHGDDLILFVSERPYEALRITADFTQIERIGELTIALGGERTRRLELYAGSGFAPLARTPAYEATYPDAPDASAESSEG